MSTSPISVENTRVTDLARAIYSIVSPVGSDGADVKAAQDALTDASAARTNGRFGILLKLAGVSQTNQMLPTEINAACAQAVKLVKDLEAQKAIATFMGHCKLAMSPRVRSYAQDLRDLIGRVWEDEGNLAKEVAKPCRKAFKREYHAFTSAMTLADKEGFVLTSSSEVLTWADDNDPDVNAKKVARELEQIAERIGAMKAHFPVSTFNDLIEFLGEVDEKVLKAARKELITRQEERLQDHKLLTITPPPPVVVSAPVVVDEPVIDEVEAALAAMDSLG